MKAIKLGTISSGDKDVFWEGVNEAESRLKAAKAKKLQKL